MAGTDLAKDFIITAEVDTGYRGNELVDRTKVDAEVLVERNGHVTFCVRGDFPKQKRLMKKLCSSLISAGYASFDVRIGYRVKNGNS